MPFSIPLLGAAVTAVREFRTALETEGGGLDGSTTWSMFYDNFGAGIANSLATSTPAKAILARPGGLEGAVDAVVAAENARAQEAADEVAVTEADEAVSNYS